MIDESDSDFVYLVSLVTDGPMSFVLFIIAMIFWYFAYVNEGECSKKQCPNDMKAKLENHSCVCILEAK